MYLQKPFTLIRPKSTFIVGFFFVKRAESKGFECTKNNGTKIESHYLQQYFSIFSLQNTYEDSTYQYNYIIKLKEYIYKRDINQQ